MVVIALLALLALGASAAIAPLRERATLDSARATLRWAGLNARAQAQSSGQVLSLTVQRTGEREAIVLVRTPLVPVGEESSNAHPGAEEPTDSPAWRRSLGLLPRGVQLLDVASAGSEALSTPIDDEGFAPPPESSTISAPGQSDEQPRSRTIAYYFPDGSCAAQRSVALSVADSTYPVRVARWTGELTLDRARDAGTGADSSDDEQDRDAADSGADSQQPNSSDVSPATDGAASPSEPAP